MAALLRQYLLLTSLMKGQQWTGPLLTLLAKPTPFYMLILAQVAILQLILLITGCL